MSADPRPKQGRRLNRLGGVFKGIALDPTPLRQSRDFRLLTCGQTVNLLGSQITLVAVPYQVFLLTHHSSLAVGTLSLMQFLPQICTYLLGGSLADMMDRRKLLLITQVLLTLASTLLAVASFLGRTPVWYIFAVAIFAAGVQAVDNPARRASIPRLIPREQIANALSLNVVLNQVGQISGRSVAGLILATTGFGTAYTIDVATFFVSIVAIAMMSPMPPENGGLRNPFPAVVESFAFLKGKPILLSNFVVDLNGQIFGLPTALFPALATDIFRNGAAGLGLLYAAPGVGALFGALLTGWCGRVRRQGRAIVLLVAVWGVAIALFGLATHFFWLALLLLVIAGAADTYTAVIRNTILQLLIPDRLRGRLSSVSMLTTTGGPRIGSFEAGAVAQLTNVPFSIVSGGVLTVLGCAVIGAMIPVYWNWDAQTAVEYTV
jgi:MFS family permease